MVNNDYTHWEMYAIGGSAEPTINSQGNRYLAPANPFAKEVLYYQNNDNVFISFYCAILSHKQIITRPIDFKTYNEIIYVNR